MNALFQGNVDCFHIKTGKPKMSTKDLRQNQETTWEESWKDGFGDGTYIGEHKFT